MVKEIFDVIIATLGYILFGGAVAILVAILATSLFVLIM